MEETSQQRSVRIHNEALAEEKTREAAYWALPQAERDQRHRDWQQIQDSIFGYDDLLGEYDQAQNEGADRSELLRMRWKIQNFGLGLDMPDDETLEAESYE